MSSRPALYRRLPVTTADAWWLELARSSPDGRVLELGAGTGRLTAALAATGTHVTAVERDPAMVAALREHLAANGVDAEVVTADVTRLPDLGTFGAVLAPTSLLNELPTVADRRAALHGAAAACAPDGRVALHLLGPWWLAREEGTVGGSLHPAEGGAAVEVTVRLGTLSASGRRRAEMAYAFGDGTVLRDHLDAAVVTPGELESLLTSAGLRLEDGAADPGRDDPVWQVVARPAT